MVAADCARENQTVPAWITIAKQKQRVVEQELSQEEKPVAQDKAEAEKLIKEKEKVEVITVHSCLIYVQYYNGLLCFVHL